MIVRGPAVAGRAECFVPVWFAAVAGTGTGFVAAAA